MNRLPSSQQNSLQKILDLSWKTTKSIILECKTVSNDINVCIMCDWPKICAVPKSKHRGITSVMCCIFTCQSFLFHFFLGTEIFVFMWEVFIPHLACSSTLCSWFPSSVFLPQVGCCAFCICWESMVVVHSSSAIWNMFVWNWETDRAQIALVHLSWLRGFGVLVVCLPVSPPPNLKPLVVMRQPTTAQQPTQWCAVCGSKRHHAENQFEWKENVSLTHLTTGWPASLQWRNTCFWYSYKKNLFWSIVVNTL